MTTAIARVELALEGCQSLKDKRQILRSLIDRARTRFQVSIAEVEDQDLWNHAVVGLAYVAGSGGHAREVIDKAVQWISTASAEAEMVDAQIELVEPV
jgi:uncharacterized protein YlxP (DUF503 family)